METFLLAITTLFISTINSEAVSIKWSTSNEVNNDRFEIERSVDGKNRERAGEVQGNGNTTSKIDYSFDDHNADLPKKIYYRLEQFDFSGRSHLSDAREFV